MKNRGEILRKRVNESGMKKSLIALKAKIAPRTLYNWFDTPNLGIEEMKTIGKIINWDFDRDLFPIDENAKIFLEPELNYDINWKTKYYDLLEDHNKLLRDMTYLNRDLGSIMESELRDIKNAIKKTFKNP